jgi:hypothetical protein
MMISSPLNWLPLFPFAMFISHLLVVALPVSPETEKAQPITMDRLGWLMVYGGAKTACLLPYLK